MMQEAIWIVSGVFLGTCFSLGFTWETFTALLARIEDSWIGNLIGVACLFTMLFASPWALALFVSEVIK